MIKRENLSDPRLPFPVQTVSVGDETIEEYIIPDDKKEAVLHELYPFRPFPSLEEERYDLHAEKKFRVRDFRVTREGGINFLVSPYYFESGGTVIDWVPILP